MKIISTELMPIFDSFHQTPKHFKRKLSVLDNNTQINIDPLFGLTIHHDPEKCNENDKNIKSKILGILDYRLAIPLIKLPRSISLNINFQTQNNIFFNVSFIDDSNHNIDIGVPMYDYSDKLIWIPKNKTKNPIKIIRLTISISEYSNISDSIQIIEITSIGLFFAEKIIQPINDTIFRPIDLKPMFDNVGEYDFFKPFQIKNHHRHDHDHPIKHQNFNLLTEQEKDSVIMEYIKCRPKSFVVILWPPAANIANDVTNYLNETGNIYHTKKLCLNKKQLKNFMYCIYDEFNFIKRMSYISKKIKDIDADDNNEITFIVYDNVKNHPIAGTGSEFKKKLRRFAKKILKKNQNLKKKKKYRGMDLIHINDYFYQTVEYCGTILNPNTNNFLNLVDFKKCHNFLSESMNNFFLLRKIIYTHLDQQMIDHIVISGPVIPFFQGNIDLENIKIIGCFSRLNYDFVMINEQKNINISVDILECNKHEIWNTICFSGIKILWHNTPY